MKNRNSFYYYYVIFVVTSLVLLASFQGNPTLRASTVESVKDTISYQRLGRIENEEVIIDRDVDLHGMLCQIPKGVTLLFKGGLLKNGILFGNDTKIIRESECLFDHVMIRGNWNVPEISTNMFTDLAYVNALKDVVALSSPSIFNRIVIENGDFVLNVKKESEVCLPIVSNTEVVIHGRIHLQPNSFKTYIIIKVKGNNIRLKGDGIILGDKDLHTGEKGEWGIGIDFENAIKASVDGLTIKDCWGDCIYVGRGSKSIGIKNCYIENGRRQGISITNANGVTIQNCKITKVGGTKPEYAIDLEPNKNCIVDNVLIENTEVFDCVGGFLATKGKKDVETKKIGKVVIRNCHVSALSKYPLSIKECDFVLIEGCRVLGNLSNNSIYTKNSKDVVIRNNVICVKNSESAITPEVKPIDVVKAKNQKVIDNIVNTYKE